MAPRRGSRITDDAVLAAVPQAKNLRQLLQLLGVAAYGGNYEIVRERLRALGVDDPRFAVRGGLQRPEPERLARAVADARSWAAVARALGMASSSGEKWCKRWALEEGLDASHFLGQGWSRRVRQPQNDPAPLRDLLVQGRRAQTTHLRRRLLREGILSAECAVCLAAEWCGRPVPLELDHVNGERSDNRLENLRLLCPNCHAQTDTYRGRNIGGAARRSGTVAPVVPAAVGLRDAALARLQRLLPDTP